MSTSWIALNRIWLLTIGILAVAWGGPAPAAVDAQTSISEVAYHGFNIDVRRMSAADKATSLPTIINQLAIVESVGLPVEILELFRKVPLIVDPELTSMPGEYRSNGDYGYVRLRPIAMPTNKPIVLHELLHAYHFNVLTIRNKVIVNAYEKALLPGRYPEKFQGAHFLENPKEYFAVMGTIYLFGRIQQPPFDCAVLVKTDPDYLAFMAKEFGPHTCQ